MHDDQAKSIVHTGATTGAKIGRRHGRKGRMEIAKRTDTGIVTRTGSGDIAMTVKRTRHATAEVAVALVVEVETALVQRMRGGITAIQIMRGRQSTTSVQSIATRGRRKVSFWRASLTRRNPGAFDLIETALNPPSQAVEESIGSQDPQDRRRSVHSQLNASAQGQMIFLRRTGLRESILTRIVRFPTASQGTDPARQHAKRPFPGRRCRLRGHHHRRLPTEEHRLIAQSWDGHLSSRKPPSSAPLDTFTYRTNCLERSEARTMQPRVNRKGLSPRIQDGCGQASCRCPHGRSTPGRQEDPTLSRRASYRQIQMGCQLGGQQASTCTAQSRLDGSPAHPAAQPDSPSTFACTAA